MNLTFNKNFKALEQILMPEYLETIENIKKPSWAEPIKSKDGTANLLVSKGIEKKTIYPIDGYKEEIDKRIKENKFNADSCTMIIGLGLGFYLEKALKVADEKHRFVIIEPDAGLINLALHECDISQYITDKKIFFVPTSNDLAFTLEFINEKYAPEDWNIFIEGYTFNNPIYTQVSFDAINILNQIRCNIGTVSNAGIQIADNDIANLPYTIHRRGVNELENIYQDKPAIIVSTGPSLRKNLWRLIDNQDKAIIIAVGQALRPLLAYGIKPDFICSVDFGEVNLTHYDGLMDSDVPLVALNQSYAELLKRWNGPMFVSSSPFISTHPDHENRVHKVISEKGWLLQGGSVSHMCYGLAEKMGCNPIIIIGQDLAYDTEQSHFPQADSRGILKQTESGEMKWEVQDPRCHLYQKDFSMGVPVIVDGYFLKSVHTNAGLASFITSFERFIQTSDKKVINATEGGAHIPGSIRMSLDRAMNKYCKEIIDNKREILKPKLSNADDALILINRSIPLLEKEITIINSIASKCRTVRKTNEKMLKALNGNKWTDKKKNNFILVLNKNTKYSLEAQRETEKMPIIKLAIYGANRQIKSNKLSVKVNDSFDKIDEKENQENFKIRIERNQLIISAAFNACRKLKESYSIVLRNLKNAANNNNLNFLYVRKNDTLPSLYDAEKYFEVGNFARPLLEAERILKSDFNDEYYLKNEYSRAYDIREKCIKMREEEIEKSKQEPDQSDYIDHIQLVYDAQKLGRETKDFDKALEMLKKAHELEPSHVVKYGLASAYFFTKEYEKSIKLFEELIEEKEIPRYLFELGQVMIYNGQVKDGVDKILKAMDQTKEFDSFLFVLGDIFCGMRQFDLAIDFYQQYLDLFPADFEVWNKLAEAAKNCNKNEIAENAISQLYKIKKR